MTKNLLFFDCKILTHIIVCLFGTFRPKPGQGSSVNSDVEGTLPYNFGRTTGSRISQPISRILRVSYPFRIFVPPTIFISPGSSREISLRRSLQIVAQTGLEPSTLSSWPRSVFWESTVLTTRLCRLFRSIFFVYG